jgi:protein O-mannosyl-transferase
VYVVENDALEGLAGLKRIWLDPGASPQYYPVVFTTFWLERQAFGVNASASHAVNLCLHIVNALLVWWLLRRLGVGAAFVAALVFAVHPVHVESVAWITERKNVLSGMFALSSMLVYWSYAFPRSGMPQPSRAARYAVSLAFFGLALLSKSVTATIPVVLGLLTWWKTGSTGWPRIRPLLPMLVAGAAMGAVTAWLEVHHVGAMGDDWSLTPAGRVLLAGRVVWFYAGKLAWPHPLMFVYPRWSIDPSSVAHFFFPLAVLLVVAILWAMRSRVGRAPFVAVVVFVASLFPVLGFLNVYPMRFSYVADHFQYLASISLIALGVGAAARALPRNRSVVRIGVSVLIVAALAGVVRVEVRKYRDAGALWEDTLAKNQASWLAHVNLGNLRLQQERTADARASFEAALRARPGLAVAHNGLGIALFREGSLDEAIEQHRKAIEADHEYAEAHNNLGLGLMAQDRPLEATEHFRKATEINVGYGRAHYNLASAYSQAGLTAEAERHYREALRLEPLLAMAHYRLGLLLLADGRTLEAAEPLRSAFALRPNYDAGHFEVGNVALARGDANAAAASYREALRINPENAAAHCNLGVALMQQGDLDGAVASLRRALALRASYSVAANNLGWALERQGDPVSAIEHYRAAVASDPANDGARANLQRLQAALDAAAPVRR